MPEFIVFLSPAFFFVLTRKFNIKYLISVCYIEDYL